MIDPPASASHSQPLIQPAVSVIVPIYNGERDLPQLIQHLLAQTYPTDRVKYLLVDNGSSDRTPDLLQAAANQHPNLRALHHTAIQSSYAARNEGIRVAQGEILVFTDADCYPATTWLENLVQPFADSKVGIVAGEVEAFPSHNWLERYAERKATLSQKSTLAHPFCPYGQTANLAVRASIFKQIGLFRPYLTSGGDADLCWRIQREGGWQLAFAEDARVQHHHRSTLKELRRQWYRYGCSNRYLHELYGMELMRSLTPSETRYRLARWLLKELPLTAVQLIAGRKAVIDLLVTPLDLVCFRARTAGQRDAVLPEQARMIARMEEVN